MRRVFDGRSLDTSSGGGGATTTTQSPGKGTLTGALQLKSGGGATTTQSPGKRTLAGALQLKSAEPTGSSMEARGLASSTVGSDLPAAATQFAGQDGGSPHPDAQSIAAGGLTGSSTSMPYADQLQASFGHHSIAGIAAHVGGPAANAAGALGADAYATGNSVAFARSPDLHTAAHEAAHVIQQRAGVHLKGGVGEADDAHERHADAVADKVVRGESAVGLLDQYSGSGGGGGLQFHLRRANEVIPGMGILDMNMQAVPAAAPAPGQAARMDGFIQFTPTAGAPNSNTIGIWQIVKATDAGLPNSDVPTGSIGALQAPRGALGQPGLRTDDNAGTGVVGGFSNDVLHDGGGAGLHAPGTALSPRYAVEPAGPGVAAWGGTTPGPRGGVGGIGELSAGGMTPGFKRSDLPEDIRSVALNDTPGSTGNVDFEFETSVRGEDTNTTYTTVTWGFGTNNGTIVHEHSAVTAGTSATFDNAIERHRDFYVHEPVVIYFAFDHDDIDAAQQAKIAGLAGYLGRNPQVVMTLDGFADIVGNAAYNVGLSERRVTSVRTALTTTHPTLAAAQVVANPVVAGGGGGNGASTGATDNTSEQPAGTGDQGGNAANGADQNREANRQFNRRVTITFSHPAGTGPAAPGGVGNPAPAPAAPAGP
jgi:outer membrane protein OmpA-like peptidoglycan-associated protein